MVVEVLANGSILITRGLDETVTVSNAVGSQILQAPATLLSDEQQANVRVRLAQLRDQNNNEEESVENTDEENEDQEVSISVEVVEPAAQTTISQTTTLPSRDKLAELAASLGGQVAA